MYSLRPWTCTVPTGPTSPVRCRLLLLELWDRTIVVLALESLLVHHKVLEGSKSKNGAAWLLFVRCLRFCWYFFSWLRSGRVLHGRGFGLCLLLGAQLSPLPLGGLLARPTRLGPLLGLRVGRKEQTIIFFDSHCKSQKLF